MSPSPDRLYELLPAVYRQRDAERGRPLRALLRVMDEQVDVVEEDIFQLYENWFIETCQDWVVPYIGDLLGYRPVHEAGDPGNVSTSQGRQRNKVLIPRREVANTIRYRRRKGTLALLELLANDVAGWPAARAVEFYTLLGLAQAINHLQPTRGRTVDLRQGIALDRLDGPFDELAHTVDVRRVTSHRTHGRYNIPSVGLFVWRLKAYPVTETRAFYREDDRGHYHTFSILGNDTPLYTRPEPEEEPTRIAGGLNLPIPIRRRAFEARKTDYYGEGKSLEIWVEGWVEGFDARQRVPPERIVPADLTDWRYRPGPGKVAVDPVQGRIAFRQRPKKGLWVSYHYGFSADIGGGEYDRPLSQPTQLLFGKDDFEDPFGLVRKLRQYRDPVSLYLWDQFSEETRQLVGSEDTGRQLEVSGDSDVSPKALRALIDELNKLLQDGDLYDEERFREVTLSEETRRLIEENPRGWGLIRLNRLLLEQAYPDEIVANSVVLYRVGRQQDLKRINAALEKWRDEKPRHAIIEITDSEVYGAQVDDEGQIEVELGRKIELGRNQTLQLRAANNTRPIIRWLDWHPDLPDALTVSGEPGSRFILDGLLIAGRGLQVEGELTSVTIRHSTLVPGWALHENCAPRRPDKPSLLFNASQACVNIEHSIIGSIEFDQEVREDPVRVLISDSILDATSRELGALETSAETVAHARLTVARSTVFGRIRVHAIDLAENSIFDGPIEVARRQWGCMRFCYVTPGSRTPRRYNCQPDLVEQAIGQDPKMKAATSVERDAASQRERERVRPRFNSVRYGTPAYCQLAEVCAGEIERGADDESEMGVFHDLFQPQREANLRARLDEYTPAGMDAGIIFAS